VAHNHIIGLMLGGNIHASRTLMRTSTVTTDDCLNEFGGLLDLFVPEDHSQASSWQQVPYVNDLKSMLSRLRSAGATARQIQAYMFGAWMISRSIPTTCERHRLEGIAAYIDEWFLKRHGP
jgi:hypothetical protein